MDCKFYKYDKIKDTNLPVSEKATLFLTSKGFVVTEKESPLLETVFEPHTIVSFKREDGVVMWLHSEQGNLDAYLAVLQFEPSEMKSKVQALAQEVSQLIYSLQGEPEELKEEDKEWITKGYVEDNEPD